MTAIARYDFARQGARFLTGLIGAFFIIAAGYVALKFVFPPRDSVPDSKLFVVHDGWGRPIDVDRRAIDWWVGKERGAELLKTIAENKTAIDRELATLRQTLSRVRAVGEPGLLPFALERATAPENVPDASAAADLTDGLLDASDIFWGETISDLHRRQLGPQVGEDARSAIVRLVELGREQRALFERLRPPLEVSVFWTSPGGSLAEVLFWALLGVLTNLLLHGARYVSRHGYRPAERWVAYTKMTYGPMLALIVVMAMLNGWIDFGAYESRVWTLPFIGFILGYNSRKTASLLDRLGERLLGEADQSITDGPAAIAARTSARLEALRQVQPQTLAELRTAASALGAQLVLTQVARQETRAA